MRVKGEAHRTQLAQLKPEPGTPKSIPVRARARPLSSDSVLSDEIRSDWAEHREELIAFWKSGQYTAPDVFADAKPWLFVRGEPDTLPWAAEQFD